MKSLENKDTFVKITKLTVGLTKIQQGLEKMNKEITNYFEILKDEKLEGREQGGSLEKAIMRGESILDRLDEMVRRNSIIKRQGQEMAYTFEKAVNLFVSMNSLIESDEIIIIENNNKTIECLKNFEEQKCADYLKPLKEQIQRREQELEKRSNELKEGFVDIQALKRINTISKLGWCKDLVRSGFISSFEVSKIEKWVEYTFSEKDRCYDTNDETWSVNDCSFTKKKFGDKRNIMIVESVDRDLFGICLFGPISSSGTWTTSKYILFSLRENGKESAFYKVYDGQKVTIKAFAFLDEKENQLSYWSCGDVIIGKKGTNTSKVNVANIKDISLVSSPNGVFVPNRIVMICNGITQQFIGY